METEKTKQAVNSAIRKTESFINANLTNILLTAVGLIIIISLIGVIYGSGARSIMSQKAEQARINAIPAEIQTAVINCEGCVKTDEAINSVLKQNVNVTKREDLNYNDINNERAKELVEKYGITKLPAIIIFGDIENNKTNFDKFSKINDALVLVDIGLPYLNVESGELTGVVDIIEITDSSCTECVELESIPLALAQSGVGLGDWKKIDYNSNDGKQLVEKYKLYQAPAILISKEIDYYESISQTIKQTASDKGEYYAFHSTIPPYKNITSGKIVGLTDIIMIDDESCDDCYDVTVNKDIVGGFGVVIKTEKTLDVSSAEAKQLISKYSIKKAPMLLISPEAKYYESLVSAWEQVGTIESDGWFVMRKPEVLGNVTSVGG